MKTHLFSSAYRAGSRSAASFAAAVVALAGAAMLAPTSHAQQSWAQSYGTRSYDVNGAPTTSATTGSGSDYTTGIARMPDGGFVVAGQIDLPELYLNSLSTGTGDSGTAALVRYAVDGSIVWQQMIRQDNDGSFSGKRNIASNKVNKVLADAQGNIFVIGGKGNGSNESYSPFAAKFDASGALIWQRGISNNRINGNPRVTGAITRDGGVLVALNQDLTASGASYDPALAKLNSDGSLAFYAVYDQAAQYVETLAVSESATENNVFVAVVRNGYGVTLLRIDGSGNLLGVRDTRDGASRRLETPVAVVGTPDGGFATLSRVGQFATEGVVLRKFTQNLAPTFEKWIQRANSVNSNANQLIGDDLVAEAGGGFLISGNTAAFQAGGSAPGGGGTEATVVRVSAVGNVEFVSALGGPRNEGRTQIQGQPSGATYVVRAADGGYALTTYSFSYRGEAAPEKSDWWTVKTNKARRVTNFGGLMADLPLEWFTVTDVPDTGGASPAFTRAPSNVASVTTPTAPNLIIENLAAKSGINKPDAIFQAANVAPDPGPPLPATTGFTVNDSATGFAVAKDSVLRLRVTQRSNAPNLIVRVQTSTTPADEGSWRDLNNGSFGRMLYDVTTTTYVLNTTSYPRAANVHFRAISQAQGNADSKSNVVGPFDLTSNAQHLGRTVLSTRHSGPGGIINFRAFDETHPSNVSMRIQFATSPGDEGNWTDLTDGNGGKMAPYRNPGDFYLDSKDYPANGALYFRAVASAPGYIDSPSRGVGPFKLINSPSPTVTVTSPAVSGGLTGGDFETPLVISEDEFVFEADAQPAGGAPIHAVSLIFDGATIENVPGSSASRSYKPATAGDHIVEASAIDELNVSGDSTAVFLRVRPRGGKIFQRLADGDWNDAERWWDENFAPGVPGANDLAVVGSFNVQVTQDVTVLAIGLHGGSITGNISSPAVLTVTGTFTFSGGKIALPNLTIAESGTLLLTNNDDVGMSGTLNNNGTVKLIGSGGIGVATADSATFAARAARSDDGSELEEAEGTPAGRFLKWVSFGLINIDKAKNRPSAKKPAPAPTPVPVRVITANVELLGGEIKAPVAAKLIGQDGAGIISGGAGNIVSSDGASIVSSDGASVIGQDGAGVVAGGAGNIISSDGASIISSDGASVISGGGGNVASPASAASRRESTTSRAATAADSFLQSGGTMDLSGIRLVGRVDLTGGVLKGTGAIDGSLTNSGGFIAPGNSPGSIVVTRDFTQTAAGSLILEIGGTKATELDQLTVGGAASLGGRLIVSTINGFTPDGSTQLVPLGYGSVTGAFASVGGNVQLDLRDTGAALSIVGANPPSAKLLNIATRLRVERGQDALIGGFIITGSAPKRVIIRALGPSLAAGGIGGVVADPTLELFRPDGSEFNDNWRDSQEGDIAATGIQPGDDREAAIVATLEAGVAYTAIVRGLGDTTGVGLVEVYDLDAAAPSTLANISTRGLVQTGENVMIGGLIIGGDQPAKVLIRAIGPSLGAAGVAGALEDPTLELYTANGAMITNDDWRATQEGEIIASTVAPSDSREAAIFATLPPGNYTAIVRGKGDTTGVALVEAYNLQ